MRSILSLTFALLALASLTSCMHQPARMRGEHCTIDDIANRMVETGEQCKEIEQYTEVDSLAMFFYCADNFQMGISTYYIVIPTPILSYLTPSRDYTQIVCSDQYNTALEYDPRYIRLPLE